MARAVDCVVAGVLFAFLMHAASAQGGLSYNYFDEIAEATCTALAPNGWTYAVRRECKVGAPTCATICADTRLRAQDGQVAQRTMRCINSLHVYRNRPLLDVDIANDVNKLGLKVYKYGSCTHASCGPNFCCCHAL